MNSYENQALRNFLDQLVEVRGITKDPQAATLIDGAVKLQPDAAYLLVQRSMLLDQALDEAKAQIAELQAAQSKGTGGSGGFLNSADAWGNSARSAAPSSAGYRTGEHQARPMTAPAMAAQPVQAAQPAQAAAAPGFLGGGMGGMLGTMAATAAGVAGGAFLFRGIGNMMNPQGAGAGAGDSAGKAAHAGDLDQSASSSSSAFSDMAPREQFLSGRESTAEHDPLADLDSSDFSGDSDSA